MKMGLPPTAPKARAGLLTPPGITRTARVKAAWLFGRGTRLGFMEGSSLVTLDPVASCSRNALRYKLNSTVHAWARLTKVCLDCQSAATGILADLPSLPCKLRL